jgi:hypothetical protein
MSVTSCGEPGALSVIFRLPFVVPVAVGSKYTAIVQLAPAANVLGQPLTIPKSDGLMVTFAIVSVPLPELVSLTFWEALLVLRGWLGNVRLVGTNVAPPIRAFPVRDTSAGPDELLFAMDIWPLNVPIAVGLKVTFTNS